MRTIAITFACVLKFVDVLGSQRDEAEAMSDEFIVQAGFVDVNLHKVNRHGGDLRDHYPPQRVGDA